MADPQNYLAGILVDGGKNFDKWTGTIRITFNLKLICAKLFPRSIKKYINQILFKSPGGDYPLVPLHIAYNCAAKREVWSFIKFSCPDNYEGTSPEDQ